MQYIRHFERLVSQAARHFPVVILTGARQTGKTTLLQTRYPDMSYVSLDLPSLAEKAENSPEDFIGEYPPPVIIDEVQYAPGLFRHIKRWVDQNRHQMGQYFLTGSQKFLLMKEVGDSLAGRAAWLELETLCFDEINQTQSFPLTPQTLARLITRGQFPEVWRQADMPVGLFYSTYLATYLERDVRQLLNVTSLRDFERFIRILASRSGQLLNKTDVAKEVGVSIKAIGDWISVLEASNQIVLLEPYFRNISKRIVKSPKIYFSDSGLLCFLLKVNEDNFRDSPLLGSIWETFVFSELRKNNRVIKNPFNLFFYRDQRAKEVDFFLERAGEITLVECKWTEFPGKKEMKTLEKLTAEIHQSTVTNSNKNNYIICSTSSRFPLSETVEAIGINTIIE